MTDKLIKELIEIIQGSKNFVISEAPDIARQIISYELWSSGLGFFLSVAVFVIMFIVWQELRRKDDESFLSFILPVALLVTFIISICSLDTIIKINTAPKLVILDYLRGSKCGIK